MEGNLKLNKNVEYFNEMKDDSLLQHFHIIMSILEELRLLLFVSFATERNFMLSQEQQ
jgi:hypothetical protein